MFARLHRQAHDEKFLLKWNASAMAPNSNDFLRQYYLNDLNGFKTKRHLTFAADLETKITHSFSINAGIDFVSAAVSPEIFLYAVSPGRFNWTRFRLEPRLYWQQWEYPTANTANGSYLAVEYGSSLSFGSAVNVSESRLQPKENSIALRTGAQWRFLQSGYFDLSYAVGKSFIPGRDLFGWFVMPRLSVGLSPQKYAQNNRTAMAPWRELYRNHRQKRMWRIGLLHALEIPAASQWNTEIPIDFEQKLGASSWSVGVNGRVRYSIQTTPDTPFWVKGEQERQLEYGFGIEIRHYPGQQRRKAAGLSGNNMNGFYWGLRGDWNKNVIKGALDRVNTYFFDLDAVVVRKSVMPVAGFQFQVRPRLFFGYQAGFGKAWGITDDKKGGHTSIWDSPFGFYEIRAGIAL